MKFFKELFGNLKFAWKYAKKEKLKVYGFMICGIFHIIISVIVPVVSAKIIVNLTNSKLRQVLFVALVLFFVENIRNVINFLARYFSQITYRETFIRLQFDLGKAILRLKNSSIDENSSGVFIQRLTNDTSKIADVFNLLNYQLAELLTNIGIFGAILIIDLRVFLMCIISVALIGFFEQKRISVQNEKDKIFRKENENVSGFIGELVRGVRDIKMLNAEKSFLKELNEKLIHLNKTRYDMGKVNRNYNLFISFLRDFSDLIMITLLVYLIYIGDMSIAISLVVHNYMSRVSWVIGNFSYLLEGLKDFNLSTSRINEIINSKKYPKESFGKKHLDSVAGNFEFKNVSFGYDDKLLFKNLSFKVKSHSTIAFVGKSGSGKTTIFNLLCKMYDYKSGSITIDGEDIMELDKDSIRKHITIISQNPYIFNLSIRDNLRLVKDNLTDEEMVEACRVACLEDFINALPDKYDTVVGEGGVSLSGGQRQRLAIAIALVQKTEIILFDEATSALDNVTQSHIQEAIDNLQGNYTIMIIAHRLSTIINSDKILFLDEGCIVAEGSHEELLKSCKDYKLLYEAEIEK